jgi:hypothetical protein
MRLKVYLMGVVRELSLVPRTNTASSFAGSVLLALRLIEWIAPGGSDQLIRGLGTALPARTAHAGDATEQLLHPLTHLPKLRGSRRDTLNRCRGLVRDCCG